MKQKTIERVARLAKSKELSAAKKLAKKLAAHQQAEQKHAQISGYRHQYESHLDQLGQSGMNSQTLRDYRQFLGNLDDAIDQQSIATEQTAAQLRQSQAEWLQKNQRVSAMEKLAEKQKKSHVLHEEKRQQRDIDELNSRR